uniref:Root meristem growth factor 9 n=1 Tax=Quercus lobata TaxID=97700 RepID=A0A7N2LZH1_QUELO
MAAVPCKRLILVAFIILCLFSTTTRARNLRVVSKGSQMSHDGPSSPKEERIPEVDVDYTPARRKPPIHN